jgi:hypothetical protein
MTSFILYLAKTLYIVYQTDLCKKIDNEAGNKQGKNGNKHGKKSKCQWKNMKKLHIPVRNYGGKL